MQVETEEGVRTGTILRAWESQMGRSAGKGEAGDIKEQIRMALEWVAGCNKGDQPRCIVPPGTEEETREEALAWPKRIMEDAKKKGPEMEEEPEGGRQGRRRGLRRVRKSHYHVFLGVLDPGQAPPKPCVDGATNT